MVKIGILGVGQTGESHLQVLQSTSPFEVVGVHDSNPGRAREVSDRWKVASFSSFEEMLKEVDAVSIATPISTRFEQAKTALKRFKHVFVENPVSTSLDEMKALRQLLREAGVKFQVSFPERFNPAFQAVKGQNVRPMFFEIHRLAKWNPRRADLSVVHDLMIHDLDLVLSIVQAPVKRVSASGMGVVSPTPDIANARVEFTNGVVANFTASRLAFEQMEKVRIFQKDGLFSLDLLQKKATFFGIVDGTHSDGPGMNDLIFPDMNGYFSKFLRPEILPSPPALPLQLEMAAFGQAIQQEGKMAVSLDDAFHSLELAHAILERIQSSHFS